MIAVSRNCTRIPQSSADVAIAAILAGDEDVGKQSGRLYREDEIQGSAVTIETEAELGRNAERLRDSSFFDAKWYLQQNPDVAAAGLDPVLHYLMIGANEGRDPGPLFEAKMYL